MTTPQLPFASPLSTAAAAAAPPVAFPVEVSPMTVRGAGIEGFDKAERLLAHLAEMHKRPHQLWPARLATFMLLRVGEVALLETSDLEEHQGRWFLHIQRGPAGALRGPLWRRVPVPLALEAAGFVAYVQGVPDGFVFSELAQRAAPGGAADAWVRNHACRHPDPALHAWSYASLRRAGRAAIEALPGGLYASAAMRGELITDWLVDDVKAHETMRDPATLAAFLDGVTFPAIGGPVEPRAGRLRWKGQRVVRLGSTP